MNNCCEKSTSVIFNDDNDNDNVQIKESYNYGNHQKIIKSPRP